MANQRDIARALGISQAAVSMALRSHPTVSPALQRQVRARARQLGYRPNPYVTTLMSHVRAGRKPPEQGPLAVIVDIFSREDWFRHESYSVYRRGVERRCAELGFLTEYFFLSDPGMTPQRIDGILHARGIRGVILAPPYVSNKKMAITWSRYACVGTGFGWQQQQMDRVAHDHDQNAAVAFRKLCGLGYSRIGLCIPSFYASGRGTRWINGYLACQDKLPVRHRVPVFLASETDRSMTRFRRWLSASRPDAVLSVYGHEEAWLTRLGLKIPRNLGLACLIRNPGTRMAGIDDRYDEVGAATVDVVASKLALNQCGIPPFPRITLIEGRWVSGRGLARKGPEIVLDF